MSARFLFVFLLLFFFLLFCFFFLRAAYTNAHLCVCAHVLACMATCVIFLGPCPFFQRSSQDEVPDFVCRGFRRWGPWYRLRERLVQISIFFGACFISMIKI